MFIERLLSGLLLKNSSYSLRKLFSSSLFLSNTLPSLLILKKARSVNLLYKSFISFCNSSISVGERLE